MARQPRRIAMMDGEESVSTAVMDDAAIVALKD